MSAMRKRLSPEEFRTSGALHEINRRVLHPMGMALDVIADAAGRAVEFGSVWDCRDDPEGVAYGSDLLDTNLAVTFALEWERRVKARTDALGFMVQPVDADVATVAVQDDLLAVVHELVELATDCLTNERLAEERELMGRAARLLNIDAWTPLARGFDDDDVPAELVASTLDVGSIDAEAAPFDSTRTLRADDLRACRVCGCTDDQACDGGCSWVPDAMNGELCSACLAAYETAVASCPTPAYHDTHRYCPSCPWTERGPLDTFNPNTGGNA